MSRRPDLAFATVLSGALEGLFLYILITNLLRSEAMLRLSVWALLLAGVIMGGVPLFQYVTGTYESDYGGLAQVERAPLKSDGVEIPGRFTQPRLAGPIGEKNRFAQVMLMLVPLGMLRIWNEPTFLVRQLAIVATFIVTIGGALAFSRGAIVAQVVLLGIAVALGYVTRRQLATVVIGVVLLLLVTPQYWSRLASIPTGLLLFQGRDVAASADGAIRGRATEMGAAALVFRDHLIFGVGPGLFPSYSQEYGERIGFRTLKEERRAHSLYLEVAAETGIFGLGCMLAIFGFTLRDLSWVRKRCLVTRPELSRTAAAFLLTVVAYGTTAVFLHLAYARYFWIMIAMSDAVTWIAANTQPCSDQPPQPAANCGQVSQFTGLQPAGTNCNGREYCSDDSHHAGFAVSSVIVSSS
jgi:O-antigen ligase